MNTIQKRQVEVHVRIKKYVAAYLKRIYGEEPFFFPSTHQASVIIENYTLQSDEQTFIPSHCLTERQWRLCEEQAKVKSGGERMMSLFAEEFELKGNTSLVEDWEGESQYYYRFLLPSECLRRGGMFYPDADTIISRNGVRKLREVLDREFWICFLRFISEQRFLLSDKGHTVALDHIMEDFLVMFCIPSSQLDIIKRAYTRERQKIRDEITAERNAVNADAAMFLHEGRPLSVSVARQEAEMRKEQEARPVYGEAVSNMREFVAQARGI